MAFDPERVNNLYQQVNTDGEPLADSWEEFLSTTHGGDPVEWIPEAEQLREGFNDAIAEGKQLAAIRPSPETDGIFAGFHQMKIIEFHPDPDDFIKIAQRIIYLTPEQYQTGQFDVPKEGIFALDSNKKRIEKIL